MRLLRPSLPLALACALSLIVASHQSESQVPQSSAEPAPGVRKVEIEKSVESLTATIHKYGGRLGLSIVDLSTGEVLAARDDKTALNPASNMKLLTAAAALWQLSGSHRFHTGLYGQRTGSTISDLVIRGQGDPSLQTSDLWQLVSELRKSGVRKITGDILVDQSFFDASFVPPAFEQQPNEWAYFRAPVSALALDRNTITMFVSPGAKDGPALVTIDPPGFVDITGMVKTGAKESAQNLTLQLTPNGLRLSAKIGGAIPEGSDMLPFPRRVDNPSLLGGFALRSMLIEQGISVAGTVKQGGEKASSALAIHRSDSLRTILSELGKNSDNFYAEMVFKSLASKNKRSGLSSADGATVVTAYLKAIGAADDGIIIRNGSGLFDSNRVTANSLTRALRDAWFNPSMNADYVAHLAIGGVDGTLHGRFRNMKKRQLVRAKTGTLNDTAALSGYVLNPAGRAPIAFAIMVNEVPGKVTGTRAAIDKCVASLVKSLLRANEPDKD